MSGFLCSMVGATYAAPVAVRRTALTVTANGNAQISTAQSQFGGASALFDGNGDYLSIPSMPESGTGDYTFECWARFDILPWNQTLDGGSYMMIASASGSDYFTILREGAGSQPRLEMATANRYGYFTKSGLTLAINTWYHLAFVRTSGVWKAFFNGTDLTSFTNLSNFTNSGRTENVQHTTIGRFVDNRGSWDGYMDEIRVSNTARYTADFTPTTTQFVDDANTVLLIHANGPNASTVFEDDNGAPKGVEFQRSSGERIRVASLGSLPSNSKAWVASAWYKPASLVTSGTHAIFGTTQTVDGNSPIAFEITGSSTINGYAHYLSGAANIDATFTPGFTVGTWYHIVFRMNGTNSGRTQCWVNGVRYLDIAADNYAQNLPHTNTGDFGMGARSMSTLFTAHCLDGCLAQVWVYAADYDIETNITKFYNNGLVDFGNAGTSSGLPTPHFYHRGSTQAIFDDINGSVTGTATVTGTLSTCS